MMGGNLGDSARIFEEAASGLAAGGVENLRVSGIFRSAAVDCVPGTPDFCDRALTGEWAGGAGELFQLCQRLEREAGRPAVHSSRESRTLDLDLILFGDRRIDQPGLIVPHPRARLRRFVLEPLAEIAPDWIFPDCGKSVRECLNFLTASN